MQIDFSRPGKPTDNAYVELFNGTLQAECLDAHWSTTLTGAKQPIEAWRQEYNESRPQSSRRERALNEFACEFAASRELTGDSLCAGSRKKVPGFNFAAVSKWVTGHTNPKSYTLLRGFLGSRSRGTTLQTGRLGISGSNQIENVLKICSNPTKLWKLG